MVDTRRIPGVEGPTTKSVELIVQHYPHNAVNGGTRYYLDAMVNPLAVDNLRPQVNSHLSQRTNNGFKSYDVSYSASQFNNIMKVAGDNCTPVLNKAGQPVVDTITGADGNQFSARALAFAVKADIIPNKGGSGYVINTKTLQPSEVGIPADYQQVIYAESVVNSHINKAIDEKIQTPETKDLPFHSKDRIQPTAADIREAVDNFAANPPEKIPMTSYVTDALDRIATYADTVEAGQANLEAQAQVEAEAPAPEVSAQQVEIQQAIADKFAVAPQAPVAEAVAPQAPVAEAVAPQAPVAEAPQAPAVDQTAVDKLAAIRAAMGMEQSSAPQQSMEGPEM